MDPGGPCERSNEEKTGFSNTCNFLIYSPPPLSALHLKNGFPLLLFLGNYPYFTRQIDTKKLTLYFKNGFPKLLFLGNYPLPNYYTRQIDTTKYTLFFVDYIYNKYSLDHVYFKGYIGIESTFLQ